MMHKAWSSIKEVPFCFSRSPVKFPGPTRQKKSPILTQIGRFRPYDAMWRERTWSTLFQVMSCCLMASQYLNECGLILSEVLWHSPQGNFEGNTQDVYPLYGFKYYQFKIVAAPPRSQCQWFNNETPSMMSLISLERRIWWYTSGTPFTNMVWL